MFCGRTVLRGWCIIQYNYFHREKPDDCLNTVVCVAVISKKSGFPNITAETDRSGVYFKFFWHGERKGEGKKKHPPVLTSNKP